MFRFIHRKKFQLVLAVAGLLVVGCAIGYLAAAQRCSSRLNAPLTSTVPSYLLINRTPYPAPDSDDEPEGYIVSFNGALNQTFLLTQGIEDVQPENMPLIQGDVLQTDEFVWTGIKTHILYVRSGDKLQIQRELEAEDVSSDDQSQEPLPRDVLMTVDLPASVNIKFNNP